MVRAIREIKMDLEKFYQVRLERLQEALDHLSYGGAQRSSEPSRSATPQEEWPLLLGYKMAASFVSPCPFVLLLLFELY